METEIADPVLREIVETLVRKYRCHSVLLYGSRARGAETPTSDYDVFGVRARGAKTRIAKNENGAYWDVFVYPEADLKKLGDENLGWRDARVLFEKGNYGTKLVGRIQKLLNKPFKPIPDYEIETLKAWCRKQLERVAAGDTHGQYRRTELQFSAIEDYFRVRRQRFWGPKAGLKWLEKNDPRTFKLFAKVYANPTDLRALKALVEKVYLE